MKEVCAYCRKEEGPLHRDHVVPRSRGGPDNATNIVLACPQCNSAKRDKLASEWLGEDCPEKVLEIERRVNRKLESNFKKRDYRPRNHGNNDRRAKLFVCRISNEGTVDFAGEVLEERDNCWRVQLNDALMAVGCGVWELSDEIKDLEKTACRIFNDAEACLNTIHSINNKLLPVRGFRRFEVVQ